MKSFSSKLQFAAVLCLALGVAAAGAGILPPDIASVLLQPGVMLVGGSVTLVRPYMGYASGTVVTLPDDTEAALITQGLATAKDTDSVSNLAPGSLQVLNFGGNLSPINAAGLTTPATRMAPSKLCNVPLGGTLLTAFDTNGRVHVAGTLGFTEIQVPETMLVTGAAVLNGTTVGTDKWLFALYTSAGALLRNTAVAGVLTANASVFQEIPFTSDIVLPPGRYFLGVQCNGTTDTSRALLATAQPNVLTGSVAGTFGTVPATITVPTTHTTAVGRVMYLYT